MEVSSIELEAQQFDFAQLKKDLFLKKNSKASRTQSPRPLPSSGTHYNNTGRLESRSMVHTMELLFVVVD